MEFLFTRDGHLLDLTLERLVAGEITENDIADHLAGCTPCTERKIAILADSRRAIPLLRRAEVPEEPAALPDNVIPLRRERPWWSAAGGFLAAAAAVLLLVNLDPAGPIPLQHPDDHFTSKGGDLPALEMEVYRNEHGESTRISSDDRVFPGDQIGFRVGSEADGHLLILGIDSTGAAYPCYPADGSSAAIQQGEPAEVPGAIHLDATLGVERLIAVRCPEPAVFDDLAGALQDAASGLSTDGATPQLRDRCAQQEVRLIKEERP